MKRLILAVLAFSLWTSVASAETYTIDAGHSSVTFRVRHVIGKVTGRFDRFEGTFDYTPDAPDTWAAHAVIDADSINTGIEKRDDHLRSADFFDTAQFPQLTFKSTKVTDVQGNRGKLHGDLTMHGVTKPIVLDLEIHGVVPNPRGQGTLAGATATAKLNRLDFGVGPASGPLAATVGNDIALTIDIEGVSPK